MGWEITVILLFPKVKDKQVMQLNPENRVHMLAS